MSCFLTLHKSLLHINTHLSHHVTEDYYTYWVHRKVFPIPFSLQDCWENHSLPTHTHMHSEKHNIAQEWEGCNRIWKFSHSIYKNEAFSETYLKLSREICWRNPVVLQNAVWESEFLWWGFCKNEGFGICFMQYLHLATITQYLWVMKDCGNWIVLTLDM